MAEPPTPTPAAGKTPRRKGGAQRRQGKQRDEAGDATEDGADVEAEGHQGGRARRAEAAGTGAGEEELFGLLGVASPASKQPSLTSTGSADLQAPQPPKQRGLLSITRAQIEASSTTPSKSSRTSSTADATPATSTPSNKAGKGKTKGQRVPKGAIPAPAKGSEFAVASNAATSSAYNLESLSKSLPSSASFFAPKPANERENQDDVGAGGVEGDGKQKKGRTRSKKQPAPTAEGDVVDDTIARATPAKKDKGKGRKAGAGAQGGDQDERSADKLQEWDIPADAGPAAAENMTWQQQLGHYPYADSPSRSSSTKKTGKAAPSHLKRATAGGAGSGAESGPGSDTDITPALPSQQQPDTPNSTSASQSTSTRRKGKAKNTATMPLTSFNGIPIGFDGANNMPGKSSSGRPGHQRRQSADSVLSHPSRSTATNPSDANMHMRQPSLATSASTSNNAMPGAYTPGLTQMQPTYVPSLMDTLPPFNPAINALRAPQTPAKGGLAGMYKVQALPLLPGEFPRLNAASGSGMAGMGMNAGMAPVGGGYGHVLGQSMGHAGGAGGGVGGGGGGGGQYAGASFHNSPAASSLPKPDLDDF